MKRLLVFGVVFGLLSGCFDRETRDDGLTKAISALSSIQTATNSPDVTVKSWWLVKDASAGISIEVCKNNQRSGQAYFDKLAQLSTDDLVGRGDCEARMASFDRQITKVEVQSDTRAVVTARIRNVAPPEEGAVLDAEARKSKEAGEPYQYVLERKDISSGWRITKISRYPSYASDWKNVYEKPKPSTNEYVYDAYQ